MPDGPLWVTVATMTWDLNDFRLVTASAYPGMMAPLTEHPSCVCVLSGDSDQGFVERSAKLLSLETLDGVRRRWRFGDVSRLADFVPKVLAVAPADDRPILLVPPRGSVSWQNAVAAWPGRVRLAASPMAVAERIAEDKIYVRDHLRRFGVPVPDELIVDPTGVDFRSLRASLGTPFVMQSPNGAGGQGTFLIRDERDLRGAVGASPHIQRWLASRYAGDLTINIAGVVHRDGVSLLPASVQSSGISDLGMEFGAYCGSDFNSGAVASDVLRRAYQHVVVVGEWLREVGHLGLFGADIAVDGEHLAFLEVNPRVQGSSWLLSKLQRERGAAPCLTRHVQALLGSPAATVDPVEIVGGSHLLMRWDGPVGVVCAVPAPLPTPGEIRVSALPDIGVAIHPGAILARLESDRSLASPDGRTLLPTTKTIVDALRAGVDVIPLP
jgi:hypothetical protein